MFVTNKSRAGMLSKTAASLVVLSTLAAPCDGFQAGNIALWTGSKVRAASPAPLLRPATSQVKAPRDVARARSGAAVGLKCTADTSALASWLSENGASVNCSPKAASGLVADRKLKQGDQACSIPVKICMTEETALKALGSKASDLDAETQIVLQLIQERAKGSSSTYAPWIATIPDSDGLNMPLFWSDEERKLLEGSLVFDETEELADALKDEFDQLVSQGWGDVLPDGAFTLENYKWAVSVVTARAVKAEKLPGGLALAPLIDRAFECAPGSAKTALEFAGMFREPRIALTAGVPVASGDVLGAELECSPSKMLSRHGVASFSEAGGQFDLALAISPMDRFYDDKADILEVWGLAEEQEFKLLSSGELDEEMKAFLRLTCVQATDAFLLEPVFRNEVWEFMQLPVSPVNEELMLDTLIGTCEGYLEAMSSKDSDDMTLRDKVDAPIRARLAAAAVLSEKRALRATLRACLAAKEQLGELEYYQERRLRLLNLDRPLDESEIVDPDVDFDRDSVPWIR